jgi:hypothetical protein
VPRLNRRDDKVVARVADAGHACVAYDGDVARAERIEQRRRAGARVVLVVAG